ncbi:hypothetical protein [Halomonas heilongjiangensis]|uniref:Uncharacterized protein n=1 Tax=Halomonas heilongjiangensis TaxID=1387883 RepID=A0A2N7TNS7_9GAMM|nr:hypothetical protein [Halomonas heilongjiangensis]PMR69768.1 hypothetical protein C1H66_09490 [Halomonas heilongjiangensis]PXX90590.1 hypothetical protein CR158_09070 [Halomonas heilongjiangensis]
MADFFTWLGGALGDLIRFVVDLLRGFFANLGDSARGFLRGLAESLGIAPSLISLLVLIVGLWLLWKGLAALLRRAFVVALVWLLLGMVVLSWLIN